MNIQGNPEYPEKLLANTLNENPDMFEKRPDLSFGREGLKDFAPASGLSRSSLRVLWRANRSQKPQPPLRRSMPMVAASRSSERVRDQTGRDRSRGARVSKYSGQIDQTGINSNISIKLTQFGRASIDLAYQNVRRVVRCRAPKILSVDMEGSDVTQITSTFQTAAN